MKIISVASRSRIAIFLGDHILVNGQTRALAEQGVEPSIAGVFDANAIETVIKNAQPDGAVGRAEYVVWRKNNGSPEHDGTWRENFGSTASGAGFSNSPRGNS